MKKVYQFLFTFLFLFTLNAKSASITIAFDRKYPPYMFSVKEGGPGLYPQIVKKVFQKSGIKVETRLWEWGRVMKQGKRGKSGIGGLYWNSERDKIYDYSEPIFEEKLNIYVKKGTEFSFTRIEDLKGKKIGLNKNWSYGEKIDKGIKAGLFRVDVAPNTINNFGKLNKGRIDALICDEMGAKVFIEQKSFKNIVPLPTPISQNKAFIAFSKSANKRESLDKFNRALKEMRKDGSYQKEIDKYFNSK